MVDLYFYHCKWEPEKKDPLHGSFFSYRPLAGTAPSAQHAFGALRLQCPPCQLDRPCALLGIRLTTRSMLRLSPYRLWPALATISKFKVPSVKRSDERKKTTKQQRKKKKFKSQVTN